MYGKRKQTRGKAGSRSFKAGKRRRTSAMVTAPTSRGLGPVYSLRDAGLNASRGHTFDITCWFPLLTVGAGSYTFSTALNFPGYGYSGGTWALLPNVMGSRARLFALYDEYRVTSLTTRLVAPSINTDWKQTTDTNDNMMYTYMDVDDYSNSTEAFMLDAGVPPRSMNQSGNTSGVTTYMVNKSAPGRAKQFFNCGLITAGPSFGSGGTYTAGTTVPPESYGAIKHLWPNLEATLYYGRLYCTWRVIFRGLALA